MNTTRFAALAMVTAGLLSACGQQGTAAGGSGGATGSATAAEVQYGGSATNNPSIAYQPDVVVVGGAGAIRSVSADGLVWTMKSGSPNLDRLQPGKILFATGIGVGRVLAVSDSNGDRAVVIGPVDITDVIKDADLSSTQPISLDSVLAYSAPTRPGLVSTTPGDTSSAPPTPTDTPAPTDDPTPTDVPTPTDLPAPTDPSAPTDSPAPTDTATPADTPVITMPAVRLVAQQVGAPAPVAGMNVARVLADSGATLPAPVANPGASGAGAYSLTPFCCSGGLGVHLSYDKNGTKMSGTLTLHMDKPSVSFNLRISGGKIVTADVELAGAAGVSMEFTGGTNTGIPGNVARERVQVPVEFTVPIVGLPIPMQASLGQVFSLSTAFSAKDATLSASGDYSFGGSLGFGLKGGSFGLHNPQGFTARKSMVDSINGLSLGVNAIIMAYQSKLSVGIGAFGFTAGVWFAIILRAGVTLSSALAAIPCRSLSLKASVAYGIGYSIPQPVAALINLFLRAFQAQPIQASGGVDGSADVFTPATEFSPAGCG